MYVWQSGNPVKGHCVKIIQVNYKKFFFSPADKKYWHPNVMETDQLKLGAILTKKKN